MELWQAIHETDKSVEQSEEEFSREFGKVKSYMQEYPYGQEDYTEVDKYKEANKVVSDLQLGYFRGTKEWQSIVNKARDFLNKMAHDFGDYYKGKENERWRDAMLALDRIDKLKNNGG